MSINFKSLQISKINWNSYKKRRKYLSCSDLILLLLYTSPIRGKTILQKQVFLAGKMLENIYLSDLGFHPFRYGPFSLVVIDSITILKEFKLIEMDNDPNLVFKITNKGRKFIERKIKINDINLQNVMKKKKDWDEWSTTGILKHVYRNYPEFTTKTKVPRHIW